jgi:tetratricopeptide (TPR) repeat protein
MGGKMKARNTLTLILTMVFSITSFLSDSPAQEASDGRAKATVQKDTIEKETPSLSLSLKQIMEQAEKNIQKVNDELTARRKEQEAKESFDEGTRLYQAGDIEGAKKSWQKALDISKDPSMRAHIKKVEKEAAQEKRRRETLEKEKAKAEKARQREIARQERDQQRKLAKEKLEREKAARAAQRKAELAQKQKEKELAQAKREQEKAARAAQREAELAQKQKEKELAQAKREQEKAAAPAPILKPSATKPADQDVSAVYNEALKMYQDKDYAGALEKFKQVKEKTPSYSRVNFYINSCEYILKNQPE